MSLKPNRRVQTADFFFFFFKVLVGGEDEESCGAVKREKRDGGRENKDKRESWSRPSPPLSTTRFIHYR